MSDTLLQQQTEIIGKSEPMKLIFDKLARVVKTDANILIYGETGTGKELIARTIYKNSLRNKAEFVPVDCASIPSNLLESELFGFEKGAFTGATGRKYGILEFADEGTLFLDEVSQLDMMLQAKLLRVLQERRFRRIGGKELLEVDMRVLSAMNVPPKKAVESGALRQDLYYRLNVIPISIPPLRHRKEDIPLLIHHFLEKTVKKNRLCPKEISSKAMHALINYRWPGNIRQLQNMVERLALLTAEKTIDLQHLPAIIKQDVSKPNNIPYEIPFNEARKKHLEKFEKRYLSKLLHDTDHDISKAARLAGISYRTIYRKIKQYGKL